jgi:ATP-dependent Clp protease protease subunit
MEAGVPAHNARHVLPTFVEHGQHGVYDLDPYSKLLSERVIFLGTTVDDISANDIVAQLLCLESDDPERDISLYLNSPGGSVTAMTAIYDTMQFVAPDIETVCLGQTGAAATILLAGGTPGKRMMLPHARVVIHQPSIDPGYGQTSDLQVQATEILRVRAAMENLLARHTGRSPAQVRADIDRETVLTGPAAVAYGVVDQVLGSRQQTPPADPRTSPADRMVLTPAAACDRLAPTPPSVADDNTSARLASRRPRTRPHPWNSS